ncbi:MAG: YchJ family metal-binding protein [Gammaproteobacteria bacterium]|nr:YchJ family metal-binding protein [Gammaproteobacteria bacterium]MDH5734622.1 YchJ family metal-binding protein [Gammaproteobacteria bacterium]
MVDRQLCRCGSGLEEENCCLKYIFGVTHAPTAEALMRSRYTAYVLAQKDYLLATWSEKTRPEALNLDATKISWKGLTICRTQAGAKGDQRGLVEFIASYEAAGKMSQVHESSRFIYDQDRWLYVDGDIITDKKNPRNAMCSCGSGKKFKRCCGQV